MSVKKMQLMGCVCLIVSQASLAQTERDLDAHEHGTSALNLVIEGDAVYLEFESPWMNLSGFEHKPDTPEQVAVMEAAEEQLGTAQDWFVVNPEAGCELQDTEVTSSLEMDGEHHHDEEHSADEEHSNHDADHDADHNDHDADHDAEHEEHANHDSDHEVEHDEHAEHDGDHEEHDHEHGGHSEVASSHTFICANPDQIETASIALFDIWSGIQVLNVQMAGAGGQDATQLSPDRTSINLEAIR